MKDVTRLPEVIKAELDVFKMNQVQFRAFSKYRFVIFFFQIQLNIKFSVSIKSLINDNDGHGQSLNKSRIAVISDD